MKRFLLQMAGITGSGKSTLARAISQRTGAVVIDKDVIMAGAMKSGVAPEASGAVAYEVGWGLARWYLENGQNVILDNPANFVALRSRGGELASEVGVSYYIIECVLERQLAESRLRTRTPAHERHPVSLAGQDIDYTREGTAPIWEPHLRVDTSRDLEVCLEDAMAYLENGVLA